MAVTQVAAKVEEVATRPETIEIKLRFIAPNSPQVKGHGRIQDREAFRSRPARAVNPGSAGNK